MMLKKPGFGFGDSQAEKRDFAIARGILETGAACSHPIAGMFMSIFEGELRDPRFIELAQAFRYHAVVLFLGRAGER